jgi:hypothetical protein
VGGFTLKGTTYCSYRGVTTNWESH